MLLSFFFFFFFPRESVWFFFFFFFFGRCLSVCSFVRLFVCSLLGSDFFLTSFSPVRLFYFISKLKTMDNFGLNVTPEAAAHISTLTGGMMSANNDERRAAEEQYHNSKRENPDQMLATLLYLSACSAELGIRTMCSVMFRKEISIPNNDEDVWVWKAASPQVNFYFFLFLFLFLFLFFPHQKQNKKK